MPAYELIIILSFVFLAVAFFIMATPFIFKKYKESARQKHRKLSGNVEKLLLVKDIQLMSKLYFLAPVVFGLGTGFTADACFDLS